MRNRVSPRGATADTDNVGSKNSDERWAEQWALHHGDLLRYALALLRGDVYAAEDVVQETAIRFWQHTEVLDGDPLGGWLRTVTRNLVIDRVRRQRSRPAEVELAPGFDAGSADPDRIDFVEFDSSLTAAVSTLSSRHRVAIWEVYARDRPVAEVAVELGVPAGTVKSRCHTARRQLATELEANCA